MPLIWRTGEGGSTARRRGSLLASWRTGATAWAHCIAKLQSQCHSHATRLLGVTLSRRLWTPIIRHRSDWAFVRRRALATFCLPGRTEAYLCHIEFDPAVIAALDQRRLDGAPLGTVPASRPPWMSAC